MDLVKKEGAEPRDDLKDGEIKIKVVAVLQELSNFTVHASFNLASGAHRP